jgi:hypothetical protein
VEFTAGLEKHVDGHGAPLQTHKRKIYTFNPADLEAAIQVPYNKITTQPCAVKQAERPTSFTTFVGSLKQANDVRKHTSKALELLNSTTHPTKWISCKKASSCWGNFTSRISQAMKKTKFAFMPPGDALERKSLYDGMVGGAIPVLLYSQPYTVLPFSKVQVQTSYLPIYVPWEKFTGIAHFFRLSSVDLF